MEDGTLRLGRSRSRVGGHDNGLLKSSVSFSLRGVVWGRVVPGETEQFRERSDWFLGGLVRSSDTRHGTPPVQGR